MNKPLLEKAIKYAIKKHDGMFRKGDKQPYIYHPIEVLSIVSKLTEDEDILAAAVLHDTIEDTETTREELVKEFNEHVADLVDDESENKRGNKDKKATWKIRKEEAIDKLINSKDIGAKMVCLGDKVANLRSFLSLYFMQGDDMWNNFNTNDPLMHYWYYNSLKEAFKELKDTAPYKEYCFLIDSLFNRYLNKGEGHEQ